MTHSSAYRRFLWFLALLLLVSCGGHGSGTGSQPDDAVSLIGQVLSVEDMSPVDGGITITVRSDAGAEEILLFPSLFTYPPPDDETLRLHEVVRQLEPGDRVRAGGHAVDEGIQLESLVILPPF
ncbi:MAG: hypothetical protein H6678_00845 [Candidatus Delongbacteria bacterium]|nr:hypothetical protein [Candidatus Delongbacteria bacterium]